MIDTATDDAVVALSANGKTAVRISHEKASHSGVLFSHIDSVLSEISITVNDLALIGTGIGPGSFTGIRIAVSTSRMMAQLLRIPLVGLHSQYLYAVSLPTQDREYILSAFDAKKSRLFAGLYLKTADGLITIAEPGDYFPEELLALIPNEAKINACGDGAVKYRELFSTQHQLTLYENFTPAPAFMAAAFEKNYYKNTELYCDITKTVPFYARKSDAEVLMLQRTGLVKE